MAEKKLRERIVQSSIDYHNKWIERKTCRSSWYAASHDMIMLMAMMMYKSDRALRSALPCRSTTLPCRAGDLWGKAFVNAVNLLCKPHIQSKLVIWCRKEC